MKKILFCLLCFATANAFAQNESLVFQFFGFSNDYLFERYLDPTSEQYGPSVEYYKQNMDSYVSQINELRYSNLLAGNKQAKEESAQRRREFFGALGNAAVAGLQAGAQVAAESRAIKQAQKQQEEAIKQAQRQAAFEQKQAQARAQQEATMAAINTRGSYATSTTSTTATTTSRSVNDLYTADAAQNLAIQQSNAAYGAAATRNAVEQARANTGNNLQSGERETFAVSKSGRQIKIRVYGGSQVVSYRMGGASGNETWLSTGGATTQSTQFQYDGDLSRDYRYKVMITIMGSGTDTFYFN